MSDPITEIRRWRMRVVKHQTELKAAQSLLWRAVAAAHKDSVPLDEIIEAAGWRTKKSVYDALERVNGEAK